MTIQERIEKLRQLMRERRIDIYIIPSADFHQSEYVGNYFKTREFMSGFTGSAGTLVVTASEAGLWTDGRYFIQAEKELCGSGITLYKHGNVDVISIKEFLENRLPINGTLGFDGRVFSATEGMYYEKIADAKNAQILYALDLVDVIWEDRPPMAKEAVFLLEETYAGESAESKLARLRDEMKKFGTSAHLLASLEDIAWLLNLRGNDITYTPVFLAFAVITIDCVHLFIDQEKVTPNIRRSLSDIGVRLHPYEKIYDFAFDFELGSSILLDPNHVNYALYHQFPEHIEYVEKTNPTLFFKSVKNDVEIENIRRAHLKDAIAHTKFLCWLKTGYAKETITELSAADKLESLRAEQEHFLSPSFAPISAYKEHAAMCHYASTPETNVTLKEGALYLTDTGAHYLEGSTDITRTVALGKIPDEWKRHYTNVLRGNLALSEAKFLYGCTGENLDILARQFLWANHLDYKHGTGHGIGYLLSVHEGPCSIKWQYRQKPNVLEPGMILSDEPGLYIENSHGIRLENELLIYKEAQNEYGQFLSFEVLTLVPFDLEAIDFSLLSVSEKDTLNRYHQRVYEVLSPYLNNDEREWLKINTRCV